LPRVPVGERRILLENLPRLDVGDAELPFAGLQHDPGSVGAEIRRGETPAHLESPERFTGPGVIGPELVIDHGGDHLPACPPPGVSPRTYGGGARRPDRTGGYARSERRSRYRRTPTARPASRPPL